MILVGIVAWPLIGAAIGYHAARRRGFSVASGIVSGASWGILAPVLYLYDWAYFAD